jgi:hypothetical protein
LLLEKATGEMSRQAAAKQVFLLAVELKDTNPRPGRRMRLPDVSKTKSKQRSSWAKGLAQNSRLDD